MSEIKFSKNFNDLCVSQGVNAGFQFEFYCERCSDTWRSSFEPYRSGQDSQWSEVLPECGHKVTA